MSELKPCPHCGGTDLQIVETDMTCCIRCCTKGCWLEGPVKERKESAIVAWNYLTFSLRWRHEPPTEPGWYWFRNLSAKGTKYLPQIVHTIELKERNSHPDDEWAGPIQEPDD